MKPSGFFLLEFSARHAGPGGVVSIDGDTVRGWDGPYLFAGKLQISKDEVILRLRVKALSANAESVFGTVGYDFDLELTGIATDLTFTLTGPSPLPGGAAIVVRGTKVAELDLR